MAKRRKKSAGGLPAKGRLRDMADQLWSLAVKIDWGHACAICNRRSNLNSHHLVNRWHAETRYSLINGICLCRYCHVLCPKRSPHLHGPGFQQWLAHEYPNIAEWVQDNCNPVFTGTTNAQFYIGQILRLRQYVEPEDFSRIVGVRFAVYLDSQGEE